jgi:hypothetical protein
MSIDMTITLWGSLLTHGGVTQTLFDKEAVSTVLHGPMVVDEDQRFPLIVFQNEEQMLFFNKHADEIKSLLPK